MLNLAGSGCPPFAGAGTRFGSILPDSHNQESIRSAFVPAIHNRYLVRQYLTNRGLGLGSFSRQRRKRSALCLNVFAVRPSIGEALADDALGKLCSALSIVHAKRGAVVMAEIELRQITVQMLL